MVFCVIFWQWRFLSVSRNEFWADATTVVLLFLERVNFVFLSVCWTWHRQTPYEGGFLIIWRYGEKVKELIVKKSRHRSFGVPKWINDDNRRRRPTTDRPTTAIEASSSPTPVNSTALCLDSDSGALAKPRTHQLIKDEPAAVFCCAKTGPPTVKDLLLNERVCRWAARSRVWQTPNLIPSEVR